MCDLSTSIHTSGTLGTSWPGPSTDIVVSVVLDMAAALVVPVKVLDIVDQRNKYRLHLTRIVQDPWQMHLESALSVRT